MLNILDYHRSSIKRTFNDIVFINNEPIVKFTDMGIIINPRVFYGGNFNILGEISGILKWFK